MNATEPMSMDQAIEALVQPEETTEVVEETESLSDAEATDEVEEEQPIEDSDDDAEEVDEADDEPESDDADDEGDEDYEDDVDDVEDDQEPEETLYTVKVDGAEEKVTLEDLKRGYSGQKYVQQGMQKAAEARKEAEDVYTALMQERQNLANVINQVQQGALNPPKEPSREMEKVKDFVEMQPHGTQNYCCGGGGGLVSLDETHDFRMKTVGRTKAEQIRATGADIVVSPCANCKKQLRELVDYHDLPVQVVGVHDLILRAIKL